MELLFELCQNFYVNGSVCESLKTGVILPLFKGKRVKANNKDNCREITLFPTLCKIYEMVLLNRLKHTMLNTTDCFQICRLDFKRV